LNLDLDLAEEDVLISSYSRGVIAAPHDEGGTLVRVELDFLVVVLDATVDVEVLVQALVPAGLPEVEGEVSAQSRIRRTFWNAGRS